MKTMRLAVAVLMLTGALPALCGAEGLIRLGAGMILDNTVPGAGAAAGVRIPGMPVGAEAFVDYFSKSGESTMPVGIRFLVSSPKDQKAKAYMGVGGGMGYSKLKSGLATQSQTHGLASGVFGAMIKTSSRAGVFVEVVVHRLLTSNATTDIAGRAGLFLKIGGR